MEKRSEKLNRPRADSSEDLKKYKALYDFAPVGYITWDERSIILEAMDIPSSHSCRASASPTEKTGW